MKPPIPPNYRLNHIGEGRYILTYAGKDPKKPLHHLCAHCHAILQAIDAAFEGPILYGPKDCCKLSIPEGAVKDLIPAGNEDVSR